MLLQEIKDEWELDQDFKREDAGNAAIDTVKLQAKYIDILVAERIFLNDLTTQRDILQHDLREWYLKRESPDTRKLLGKTTGCPLGGIVAANASVYVARDNAMIACALNISRQDIKVEYIKDILAALKDRGWGLTRYIEWTKFKSGQ